MRFSQISCKRSLLEVASNTVYKLIGSYTKPINSLRGASGGDRKKVNFIQFFSFALHQNDENQILIGTTNLITRKVSWVFFLFISATNHTNTKKKVSDRYSFWVWFYTKQTSEVPKIREYTKKTSAFHQEFRQPEWKAQDQTMRLTEN